MLFKILSTVKQCRSASFSKLRLLSSASRGFESDSTPMINYSMKEVAMMASDDEKLLLPYNHIKEIQGKKTRMRIINGYNHWLRIPEEIVQQIEEVSEIVHNYDILIDDMEDNSILRRGLPVANSIFGFPNTINSANFSIFLGLQKCLKIHPMAAQIYIEQILELHRGQGMEMYWRENGIVPSEEQWKLMTIQKIAGMVMIPLRLMQLFSDNKTDYSSLFPNYSLYIQIKDDYTDTMSEDPQEYKAFCEDVSEGKYAFPLLHALHKSDGEKVLAILRQRSRNIEMKKYCLSLLEKHGSFEYTVNSLRNIVKELRKKFAEFGGNPILEEILNDYEYIIEEKTPAQNSDYV